MDLLSFGERYDFCLCDFIKNCTVAKDVKSVALDCRPHTTNLFYFFIRELAYYTSGFSNLTKVTTWFPLKPIPSLAHIKDDDRDIHAESNDKVMQQLLPAYVDALFGVKHRLVKTMEDEVDNDGTAHPRKFANRDIYVWDVDGEKVNVHGQAEENKGEKMKTLKHVVLHPQYTEI